MVDGKVVPTLVYRRREHRIDLTELPLTAHADGVRPALDGLEGYHLARWSDSDRIYVAVTDLPAAELADFVTLFRAAAKGERERGANRPLITPQAGAGAQMSQASRRSRGLSHCGAELEPIG